MQCPRCRQELAHIHSQFLDECAGCGGVWYDADELRRSKDAARPDLGWLDFEFWQHQDAFHASACQTACPRCHSALVALEYGETGVEIDACPACTGIWLDRGEFDKIVQALDDEANAMDVSDYLKAALTEAREVIAGPEGRASEWRDLKGVMRMLGYRLFADKPALVKKLLALQRSSPFK